MKKAIQSALVILVVATLAGCATGQVIRPPQIPADESASQLVLIRTANFAASANVFNIGLDGDLVFSIGPGEYAEYPVRPGRHVVSVHCYGGWTPTWKEESLQVNTEAGQTYYFLVGPSLRCASISSIAREDAESRIKESKLVFSGKDYSPARLAGGDTGDTGERDDTGPFVDEEDWVELLGLDPSILEGDVPVHERPEYIAAMEKLRSEAESGSAEAQYSLGYMYRFGEGLPKDNDEAYKWLSRAAGQGHPDAQVRMGAMSVIGDAVPQDLHKGTNWFLLAAKQGNANGQFWAGYMYLMCPSGKICSCGTARKYFLQAADQGQVAAQLNLGILHETSRDSYEEWVTVGCFEQDYIEAYKWYEIAAVSGLEEAARQRASLARRMSSEDIAMATGLARAWIRQRKTPPPTASGRDLSTPANSVIGHWKSGQGDHLYLGEPSLTGYRLGRYILVHSGGKTVHLEYRIVGQNPTDRRVNIKVYHEDGSYSEMGLYPSRDGDTLVKSEFKDGKRKREVYDYIDNKVKP